MAGRQTRRQAAEAISRGFGIPRAGRAGLDVPRGVDRDRPLSTAPLPACRWRAYSANNLATSRRLDLPRRLVGMMQEEEHRTAKGRRVMVVHGRNLKARDAMFQFLRAVGLAPIPWHEAVSETGMGSPHNLTAVRAAMDVAQAVVVVLTSEERAGLLPGLANDYDASEVQIRGQPRQNVILEAGMALGINQKHTILVELGSVREASDFAGMNRVRLDNTPGKRHELLRRLAVAGCEVVDTGEYFDTDQGGDFESCIVDLNITDQSNMASPSATMVSRDPDHLEAFWIGPNREVLYRWWLRPKGWSRVESWAEPEADYLAAVSRGVGDEILFGIAPDGRVWYRIWKLNDRGWHTAGEVQWFDDDHVVRGPLATASRGLDMIELFAFDIQGQPCHRWTEGGMRWSSWTRVW